MSTSISDSTASGPSPRRWFQFRLRTLLVFVTLSALVFACAHYEMEQRRRSVVVDWIESHGGDFAYSRVGTSNSWIDRWIWRRVRYVDLSIMGPSLGDLSPLCGLQHLEELVLAGTEFDELSPLGELHCLRTLDLSDTNVRDLAPLRELDQLTRVRVDLGPVSLDEITSLNQSLPGDPCVPSYSSISHLPHKRVEGGIAISLEEAD